MAVDRMELTLGPLLFHWPEDVARDFYARIADESEFDRVYLGEIVCSKRWPFTDKWLPEVAERLRRGGKAVVWSTPALPSATRERRVALALARRDDLVEINETTALAVRNGAPFVAGPLLNIYNEDAAAEMIRLGCTRLCANVELSLESIAALHRAHPELEIELFAFGRLPLAISARCYHARRHGLHKDGCLFLCGRDADGMDASTFEGQPFLAVNGVQTLSHAYQCLDVDRTVVAAAGIGALRLSPHSGDMIALARAFRGYERGAIDLDALRAAAKAAANGAALASGYLRGGAGVRAPT
jgi:collagenase-like PrtC family protease